MTTMSAVQFNQYGPPSVLKVASAPRPRPTAGQVLVRVRATSVHPHDLLVRSGRLAFMTGRRFPKGTGMDFAGEIAELGEGVAAFGVGDRVWGILPAPGQTGAAAEFVALDVDQLSKSPESLDFVQAAALSGVGAISIISLRDRARLQPGERVLIRGAAGGVGSIAVQFAHALGAKVVALAGAKDLEFVKQLGADAAFDYSTTEPNDLGKFDVILDLVGADLPKYRRLLTPRGRMMALVPGSLGAMAYILLSSIHGPRRVQFFSCAPKKKQFVDLAGFVDRGELKPVVDGVFPLEDIVSAHKSLESGGRRGKRVVTVA